MTKTVEITVEITKHHGLKCLFEMAVPCKKNPAMSACLMDGKCCSWTTINWPEEWLKCKRFVEFCERMLPGGKVP